jgi:molybdopterin converting factor small subunit
MHVTVTYRAQLKRAVGRPSERVEVAPGCTLRDLLARLAEQSDADARALLAAAQGDIAPSLLAFVGAEQAEGSRVLKDGDEVLLLAPMAGG